MTEERAFFLSEVCPYCDRGWRNDYGIIGTCNQCDGTGYRSADVAREEWRKMTGQAPVKTDRPGGSPE